MKISLLDVVVENVSKGFCLILVGRFLSYRPTIKMVRKWVSNRWKLKASIMVVAMVRKMFLLKFINEEHQNKIFAGPWKLGKHNLVVAKWKPGFNRGVNL